MIFGELFIWMVIGFSLFGSCWWLGLDVNMVMGEFVFISFLKGLLVIGFSLLYKG